MKKVLLLSLILAIGSTGFAQKITLKKGEIAKQSVLTKIQDPRDNNAVEMNFEQVQATPMTVTHRTAKGNEDFDVMQTRYDKQSNGSIGNRIAVWPDGSVSIVATWSSDDSYATRGAGYNHYNGSEFGEMPTGRIEDIKSGWPSICAAGEAEIMASHATGTNIYRREKKGEGGWELITNFEKPQWPRVCASGNGQYVHMVGTESYSDAQGNSAYHNWYSRSTDGGLTWSEPVTPPEVDEALYYNNIGADDYVMASNGNNIAILFGGMTYEMFYIISHDNGETWEKQVVTHFPYGHGLDWYQDEITSDTDSIWSNDNSQSIAIDNKGTVHVAFGLTRFAPAPESGFGYITYWPYTDAIVYWNSEYVNEQGGHDIPLFGDWSGDTQFDNSNGIGGVSNTLMDERLAALAEADGEQHLHLFGWPDETGDGMVDYTEHWDGAFTYVNYGISTTPGISIDDKGNMAIIYSCLDEGRPNEEVNFYYRSAYVTYRDSEGTWFDDVDHLSSDFSHMLDETYPTFASCNAYDGSFWVGYSADNELGLQLDDDDPQGGCSDNIIWAVKLTPDMQGWNVSEAVNPMTSVRVYPNPAQDVLNLEINASQASELNVAVYNITGQKVMEESRTISTGYNLPSLNISSLNSGIYFVTVKANGFENTIKFVVK